MNVLICLITNAEVLLFSFIILSQFYQFLRRIDKLLTVAVFSVSYIIFSELVLGVVFQRLTALYLFAITTFILLIMLIFLAKQVRLKSAFNEVFTLLREFIQETRGSFTLCFMFCAVAFIILLHIFFVILLPPDTTDALAYHLPAVAHWLRSGKISTVPNAYSLINTHPMNTELLFLWNSIFLNDDIIVDSTQLFFAILGAIGIYAIGRRYNISKKASLIAGYIYFLTPCVLMQLRTCYVDIALASSLILLFNFFLIFLRRQNTCTLLLWGLASGIALGIKHTAIIFIAILICIWFFLVLSKKYESNISNKITKTFLLQLFLFFFIIALIGSYWYVRNLVLYKNPIYPYNVSFLGTNLFHGLFSVEEVNTLRVMECRDCPYFYKLALLFFDNTTAQGVYTYDSAFIGFGPIFSIIGIPSFLFCLFLSFKTKNISILLYPLISIIIFLLHPVKWYPRYHIYMLPAISLSIAYTLDHLNFSRKAILTLLNVLILYVLFHNLPNFRVFGYFDNLMHFKRATIPWFLQNDYAWAEDIPQNSMIGYDNVPHKMIYNLFGYNFKNDVINVASLSENTLQHLIKHKNINYIVVGFKNSTEKQLEELGFKLWRVNPNTKVYIRKGSKKLNAN